MTHFQIQSAGRNYAVTIANRAFERISGADEDQLYIVDAFFRDRAAEFGTNPIFIEAAEQNKTLDQMTDVICKLREAGVSRRTKIIAVGGGVIQDISAFAASIYMRGIEWTFVPTTLLAMADSCIGGKSSINVGAYKNIVGTFFPPVEVVIDTDFTRTLQPDQIVEGLCEAVKICFVRGSDAFNAYLAFGPSIDADHDTLSNVVGHALIQKAWFIEIDEFDRAERLLLNFGHTFGHAIETASHFRIAHGIAVGLGMLTALAMGTAMGRTYPASAGVAILEAHIRSLLASLESLGAVISRLDVDELIEAFHADKKHTRQEFAVILVAENGDVERVMLPRDDVSQKIIAAAFSSLIKDWSVAKGPTIVASTELG